ncbi:MAG: hypothetical protein AMS26_00850 [Bacteroides sp. SM23_62]|nr:MAG: hypothetical protein AMS26_00850 [Bacteroides sp. SM23_62]
MPTVLRVKGYRFFFFSNEGHEPIHIHVEKAESYAKFWLDPIRIAIDFGFNSKELREINSIIEEHQELLIEKWDEYFAK